MNHINENYFTEDIFIKNDIMYYKNKPIKKHNWHHILCEIGWNKMNVNWIKKLNSYHPNPYKNSQYGLLDVFKSPNRDIFPNFSNKSRSNFLNRVVIR